MHQLTTRNIKFTMDLFYIFGIRVSRATLFEWISKNPDHKLYKDTMRWFMNDDIYKYVNLHKYIQFVKGEDVEAVDTLNNIDNEMIQFLDEHKDPYFRLMEITHDICDYHKYNIDWCNNVVIGIVTDTISLSSGLVEPLDPESKFPFTTTSKFFAEEFKILENHPFIKFTGQELKHYVVQNICVCCM